METNNLQSQRVSENAMWYEENIFMQTSIRATEEKAINLGQGASNFKIPDFLLDSFSKNIKDITINHGYNRNDGSLKLASTISKVYSKNFKRQLKTTEILVVPGAQQGIMYAFLGFLNPGEEVILIEPFFKQYLTMIEMAGGKSIGVPLNYNIKSDQFELDYNALQKAVDSPKAKILLLNSPHNPSGKLFSEQEYLKIANIVNNNNNLLVLSDEVYERVVFDNKEFIHFANISNMYDRTMSVFSAGKTFSMTGLRLGWVISTEKIIKVLSKVNINISFCMYEPTQSTIADSLENIQNQKEFQGFGDYYQWLSKQFEINRDNFQVAFEKTKVKMIKPEGGFFAILDISEYKLDQKYYEGQQYHDVAFCNYLISQHKIAAIPLSTFYVNPNIDKSYYVRIALCKDHQMTQQACQIFQQLQQA